MVVPAIELLGELFVEGKVGWGDEVVVMVGESRVRFDTMDFLEEGLDEGR